MAINLPGSRAVFIPPVPSDIQDAAVRKYLSDLKATLEAGLTRQFENAYAIVSTGTSGTFTKSGGGTVTVSSGIITNLA